MCGPEKSLSETRGCRPTRRALLDEFPQHLQQSLDIDWVKPGENTTPIFSDVGEVVRTDVSDESLCGAVAQLGERCVRNAEVGGSNPLGSTKLTS